jgi:hypothetical protein
MPNDIEFSGERKRVRCNEGLAGALPSPKLRIPAIEKPFLGRFSPVLSDALDPTVPVVPHELEPRVREVVIPELGFGSKGFTRGHDDASRQPVALDECKELKEATGYEFVRHWLETGCRKPRLHFEKGFQGCDPEVVGGALVRRFLHAPANDIEFSGERKRVRCNEGLDGDAPYRVRR